MAQPEVHTFNMKDLMEVLKENKETIFEEQGPIKITLKFYWNSHGRMIPWEVDGSKSKTLTAKNAVKIEKLERNIKWKYSNEVETMEDWNLFIDSKPIDEYGSVCEYRFNANTKTMSIKIICGEG